MWGLTSWEQQRLYGPRIEKADERFRAATDHVEDFFSYVVRKKPEGYPPAIRWLYHRVPKGSDYVW